MIKTRTCFVLGAGASQSYGFPLGRELVTRLVDITARGGVNRHGDFRKRMIDLIALRQLNEASEAKIFEFSNLLRRSNLGSIDLFLNFHQSSAATLLIGKAGIGFLLGECENPDTTRTFCHAPKDDDNWLGFLWNELTVGARKPSDVLKAPISFVTFNYDRSLEFLLTDFAKASFGWTDKECEELLNAWPIIHVYGDLGEFPRHSMNGGIEYAAGYALQHMESAIDRIRTIHEVTLAATEEDEARILSAQQEIYNAERVIFLGCAYHEENMKLLKVRVREKSWYFLSRYGLSDVQIGKAMKFISRKIQARRVKSCSSEDLKSREFLRQTVEL